MILFYNKDTGEIIGTIDGRIHSQAHLNMWIGDRDKTERLVVSWKVVKKEEVEEEISMKAPVTKEDIDEKKGTYKDYVGFDYSWDKEPVPYKLVKRKRKRMRSVWKPDFWQTDLMEDIERGRKRLSDYRFNLKTKRLEKRKSMDVVKK